MKNLPKNNTVHSVKLNDEINLEIIYFLFNVGYIILKMVWLSLNNFIFFYMWRGVLKLLIIFFKYRIEFIKYFINLVMG